MFNALEHVVSLNYLDADRALSFVLHKCCASRYGVTLHALHPFVFSFEYINVNCLVRALQGAHVPACRLPRPFSSYLVSFPSCISYIYMGQRNAAGNGLFLP